MWTDSISKEEVDYCQTLLKDLKDIQWIQPLINKILINKIRKTGSISPKSKPLLFELRFAAELCKKGLDADYEYKTGVNNSTIDFRVNFKDSSWLVELVSIEVSNAVRSATKDTGLYWTTILQSNSEDIKQSEEGEIIIVQQKIGEKVYKNGKPIKFPPISDNVFSLILIDMRGYLDDGGNVFDYREIAYGIYGLEPENSWMAHYWKNKNWDTIPIKGIFDRGNPLRAAKVLHQRIHFLGFVNEKEYGPRKLMTQIYFLANPWIFETEDFAKAVYEMMPFRN